MVRNLIGGCKAKRLGRKFATTEVVYDLQLASTPNELYACVHKIYGGTISVIAINGEELLCTIRKKFKGRNKRNNLITMGSIVLVELYDWQSTTNNTNKKRKCNLVNVYDSSEYDRLLLLPHYK
jgi:translation initiation factor IF-1